MLIPPSATALATFSAWLHHANKADMHLGEHAQAMQHAQLGPGDLVLVPAGWAWGALAEAPSVVLSGHFFPAAGLRMQAELARLHRKLMPSVTADTQLQVQHLSLDTANLIEICLWQRMTCTSADNCH